MARKDLVIGILHSAAVMAAVPVGIFGLSSKELGMNLALGFLSIFAPVVGCGRCEQLILRPYRSLCRSVCTRDMDRD